MSALDVRQKLHESTPAICSVKAEDQSGSWVGRAGPDSAGHGGDGTELASKWNKTKAGVRSWIHTRLAFAVIRGSSMCILDRQYNWKKTGLYQYDWDDTRGPFRSIFWYLGASTAPLELKVKEQ